MRKKSKLGYDGSSLMSATNSNRKYRKKLTCGRNMASSVLKNLTFNTWRTFWPGNVPKEIGESFRVEVGIGETYKVSDS